MGMITGSPHYTWRRLFDPLSIDMVKLPDHLIRHGAGYLNDPLFRNEQGCLLPWFTWRSLHDPLIRHGEGSLIPSLDMEIVIWSPHWHGEDYLNPSSDMEKITWSSHWQGELIDKERVTWSPHRHGEGKKQLMEPDCSLHILVKHSEQVITHNLRVTSTIIIIFRLWISWHQN